MDDENKSVDGKSCWRNNGVWGTALPRCEKLKYVNHCRHCDVFEKAAIDAFSSARKDVEKNINLDVDIEQQSCLPFRLSTYCFSVPTNAVLTISDQVALHSIPFNRNKIIKGLVAINNEVYPLLNMPDLLSLKTDTNVVKLRELRKLYKRILIVNLGERCVAFYVDDIYRIHHFFEKSIQIDENQKNFSHSALGYLEKRETWCNNCYLLNLADLSMELEKRDNESKK